MRDRVVWDVAHVITHLEVGGAQDATLTQVSRSRFSSGVRTLIADPTGSLYERALRLNGVQFVPVPQLMREASPLSDSQALGRLVLELRRLKSPNSRLLVHTHCPKAGVLGRLSARVVGADVVVHSFHGFGHGRGALGGVYRKIEQSCARLADGYTADSAANHRQGIRDRVFGGRPVRVIHCGIDLQKFSFDARVRDQVRAELGVSNGQFLVLTLANMKKQKDPMTFVRVVEEVCRQREDVVFAYAGDGPLRPTVERALGRLGLASRVRLLGWRSDAEKLLSSSDLFLLTSKWEGLPQTFGQAMAAGRPIVATDVDGASEAVEVGVNGFLANAGDALSLADAVIACARDPALAQRLGRAGFAKASKFSDSAMLSSLDSFYEELAAR